jgi:hypothetical protein
MTGNDEALSMRAVEIARNLNRRAASECEKQGISSEDVTIAALYSAFDLAAGFTGSRIDGVEWLRNGLHVIERQLMQEQGGTIQ